jgi:hypothetical protein
LNYYGPRKANRIKIEKQKILVGQSPENLKSIYEKLDNKTILGNGNRLVYWKWHIKEALGLTQPDRPEQWPTNKI